MTTALLMTALNSLLLQDVKQKPGEERAGAERYNREIEVDPQAERETVVHVRLIQALARQR